MKIALVSLMRLESERMPRKMLAKINGVSLAERSLRCIRRAAALCCPGAEAFAGVGEPELIEIAESCGVEVLPREPKSYKSRNFLDTYSGWPEILKERGFDAIIRANAGFPFLTPYDICQAVSYSKNVTHTFQVVFQLGGSVWDTNLQNIFGTEAPMGQNKFYISGHLFFAYAIQDIGDPDKMFPTAPESLFEMPYLARFRFDVDTLEDLQECESVACSFEEVE